MVFNKFRKRSDDGRIQDEMAVLIADRVDLEGIPTVVAELYLRVYGVQRHRNGKRKRCDKGQDRRVYQRQETDGSPRKCRITSEKTFSEHEMLRSQLQFEMPTLMFMLH